VERFSVSSVGVSREDFRRDERGNGGTARETGERTGEDGGVRFVGCGWTARIRHLNLGGTASITRLGAHNQNFYNFFRLIKFETPQVERAVLRASASATLSIAMPTLLIIIFPFSTKFPSAPMPNRARESPNSCAGK